MLIYDAAALLVNKTGSTFNMPRITGNSSFFFFYALQAKGSVKASHEMKKYYPNRDISWLMSLGFV